MNGWGHTSLQTTKGYAHTPKHLQDNLSVSEDAEQVDAALHLGMTRETDRTGTAVL
ncbi:hypothetical protein NKH80_01815 [Mesorhizobium sp. M0904]|uniref:hypothetical protein n=1 Tax=unclassified Mesorhizobium TaxID=325217 RepID=UPI003334EF41